MVTEHDQHDKNARLYTLIHMVDQQYVIWALSTNIIYDNCKSY